MQYLHDKIKTKTVRLPLYYRLNNGKVEKLIYTGNPEFLEYEWRETQGYHLGDRVMLMSNEDISCINQGKYFYIIPDCPNGVPGNVNSEIAHYHGRRGAINGTCCLAHGLRKITRIRELNSRTVAITVGRDLTIGKE